MILLLLSDTDGRVCCTVFVCTISSHRDIAINVILPDCSSHVGVLVSACGDAGLCHLMLMILHMRLKSVVSSPSLCPVHCSSKDPTRDDRRHWPSSACISLLDPWSRVVQLRQPVRDLFLCQPQPLARTQDESPFVRLSKRRHELAIALGQFSSTCTQDRPSLRHHRSKPALRK